MARKRVRLKDHPARSVASLLSVSLCLAVGLLFVSAGGALAISGFGSDEPAVRAQYPDDSGLPGRGGRPVISSLGAVVRTVRETERSPKAAARLRQETHVVRQKVAGALSSAPGLDARQSGSIVLLIVGIAVLAIGGVLRWRRGLTQNV